MLQSLSRKLCTPYSTCTPSSAKLKIRTLRQRNVREPGSFLVWKSTFQESLDSEHPLVAPESKLFGKSWAVTLPSSDLEDKETRPRTCKTSYPKHLKTGSETRPVLLTVKVRLNCSLVPCPAPSTGLRVFTFGRGGQESLVSAAHHSHHFL